MRRSSNLLTGLAALAPLWLGASLSAFAQTVIPESFVLPSSAADTTRPGFVWRIHQVTTDQAGSVARAEAQLAGLLGKNVANPENKGIAIDVAVPADPETAPISFEIEGVLNLAVGGGYGNFKPDDAMPGLPGSGNNNAASETLTWLDLPAGAITMGVNSDDGFRLTIGGGAPVDQFGIKVGEFDANRGAGDTIFTFNVQKAGLYAARLVWFQGGGDANVEWFTVNGDTKVLVNDLVNGGIPAFRGITTPGNSFAQLVFPAPDSIAVSPDAPIRVELKDGGVPVKQDSIQLKLDGVAVTANKSAADGVTTLTYQPAQIFASGSKHTASLTYTDATQHTVTWSFTTEIYGTLPATAKVAADTSKPGFNWSVYQVAVGQIDSIDRAERQLAGVALNVDATFLPNIATAGTVGAAIGAAPAPESPFAALNFEIDSVINLSHTGGDQNGNFPDDEQMPGIDTAVSKDNIAVALTTFIELPAGLITMGVNSDDGFKVTGGTISAIGGIPLSSFEGTRAAANTQFHFVVAEAGVYPFRVVYEQGGSAASIEWYTVKADGTKVLLNDVANGGFKAFRAPAVKGAAYVKALFPPAIKRAINQPSRVLVAVLADGAAKVDESTVTLSIDGSSITPTVTREGDTIRIAYTPENLQVPSELHTAKVEYKVVGGATTLSQEWQYRNLKNIILPQPFILETFDDVENGKVPENWVELNFTDTVKAGEDLTNPNSDSYKGWVVISRDILSATFGARRLKVAPNQFVNGELVTTLVDGSTLYAESDNRDGSQVQFLTSKPYDLSTVNNVVLSFNSIYEQNQDSIGSVEYSVDGGKSWLPVVYYLDPPDIKYTTTGEVDAVRTLLDSNLDTGTWVDPVSGEHKGGYYGAFIAAPITQELASAIEPRINDDQVEGKRVEVFRLPAANNKPDVRIRFAQGGTGSWYFGVDNLGFYDAPNDQTQRPKLTVASSAGGITISWVGNGLLEESTSVNGPFTTSASQSNPQAVTATGAQKFYRIRQ